MYFLIPDKVVHLLFGSAYLEAAPLLPFLGVAMLAYELALLGIYRELGIHRWGILKPVGILAIAFPILIWAFHNTVRGIAFLMVVLAMVTLASTGWFLLQTYVPSRSKKE